MPRLRLLAPRLLLLLARAPATPSRRCHGVPAAFPRMFSTSTSQRGVSKRSTSGGGGGEKAGRLTADVHNKQQRAAGLEAGKGSGKGSEKQGGGEMKKKKDGEGKEEKEKEKEKQGADMDEEKSGLSSTLLFLLSLGFGGWGD